MLLAIAAVLFQLHEIPRGQIVERVQSGADASQTYALYLPSRYSPDRSWPIIYCFDPRARGRVPLERFQPAAEKYGYILAGSNASRNARFDLSVAAMNAMWTDTHARFPIDAKRCYSAGFSGGARVATSMALQSGLLAGVFVAGGGFPGPIERVPFALFGAAGSDDFNWYEVKQIDAKLDELRTPHRVVIFDGPHTWPPAEVATRAVEWFELLAMRTGARARDEKLIDALLQERAARVDALPATEQYVEMKAIADDFEGLRDLAEYRKRIDALEKDGEAKRHLKAERRELERQQSLEEELQSAMRVPEDILERAESQTRAQSLIRRTRGQASAEKDSSDRRVARRVLGGFFVGMLEQGREDLQRNRIDAAVRKLTWATELQPESAAGWYDLARALASSGDEKKALDALAKAIERGFRDGAQLEAEPAFAKLRGRAAFTDLLVRMKK